MKKIFLTLLLWLPFAVSADNVTSEQAHKIAQQFFGTATTRAGALTLKWDGRDAQTRTQTEPAFYVFDNSAGGFVIIAGDDCVEPVLGYSLEGEFVVEGMPANVRYWFDHLKGGIDHLRAKHSFVASQEVLDKWEAFRSGAVTRAGLTPVEGGKKLETAKWNQTGPYNLLCSEWCNFSQGAVYTGCVATATAIIMRYHKWPAAGYGTLPDYSYRDDRNRLRNVKGFELGEPYDWDNMQLSYREFENPKQADFSGNSKVAMDAVGRLMLDCGVMVQMQYGTYDTNGSGAYTADVPRMLAEHMYYDKAAERFDRELFAPDEWKKKIADNIDNCGPVLFSAITPQNYSHAFVLDGYDGDYNISINFGWGGADNGYYAVPNFDDYTLNHAGYFNIKPDEGGEYADTFMQAVNVKHNSQPTATADGLRFSVSTEAIYNGGLNSFSGEVYLAHADKHDNIKSIARTLSYNGLGSGMGWSFVGPNSISMTVKFDDMAVGDVIKWFYKLNGHDEVLPARYNIETDDGVLRLDYLETFEKSTSMHFDADTRLLTLKSDELTDWSLTDASGADLSECGSFAGNVLAIDASGLAGSYKLSLSSKYARKTLTLTF